MLTMKVRYETFSECGPRWNNEDYIKVIGFPQTGRFMAVLCDGMYIFICSDGVYGERKEKGLEEILCSDNCAMGAIKNLASSPAHDNYSGIMIEVLSI